MAMAITLPGDQYFTKGVLIDRRALSLLSGIAARRQEITHPNYGEPRRLAYNAPWKSRSRKS
jgi:hypothetical protein